MTNRFLRICGSISSSLAVAALANADTVVGGPIFGDTTWDLAGSPYCVTSSIVVGVDATLTIDPGVEVRVDPGLGFAIGSAGFGAGTLVACGTLAQPILFTSKEIAPERGDWNDILFNPEAVDATFDGMNNYVSGSILEHCIIEYAGGGDTNTGSITIEKSSPYLANVEVRHSARTGIRARDMTATPSLRIEDSELWDCVSTGQSGGGIYINAGNGHELSGINCHDNSISVFNNGGGIYVQNATGVSLTGSILQNNGAYRGGGFYGVNVPNFFADNTTVSGNSASDDYGGMILTGSSSNVVLTNLTIDGNMAADQAGGIGLLAFGASMDNCQVTNNISGRNGGGMLASTTVAVTNNTITGNQCTAGTGPGGGIYQSGGSNATYSGNTIDNNTSAQHGGGLYLNGSGHLLSNNLITNNFAFSDGGGAYVNSTNTTFTECTVTQNEAMGLGGGFYWNAAGGSLAGVLGPTSCNTIDMNIAPGGQSIYYTVGFEGDGSGDLDASQVCWGTNDPNAILARIFDYFDDGSRGIVRTTPFVGGPILGDTVWDLPGSPYIIMQSVIMGNDSTLTIDPGVEIRIEPCLAITIGSDAFGPAELIARGTLAQPILFTSGVEDPDVPQPGDWHDIFLTPFATSAVFDEKTGEYLSGSIIEHCIMEYAGCGDTNTGSITIENSSPYLTNVEVRHSARTGIRARDMTATPSLRIEDSELWDCVSTGQSGGGIYINAGNGHELSGINCHDNSISVFNNGGGIYVQNATGVSLTGSILQNNGAYRGGGFYGVNVPNFFADNTTVSGNSASDDYGGMILTGSSSNVVLTNLTIDGNMAADQAGGIGLLAFGASMDNCQVTNNISGRNGGGMLASTTVAVTNNTITGNQCTAGTGPGGGIYQSGGSNATYSGNTIDNNTSAQHGGGLYLNGSGHLLSNNLITNNFAFSDGGGAYVNSTNTTFVECNVQFNEAFINGGNGGGFFWNATGGSIAGNQGLNTFNILANNDAQLGQSIYYNVGQGNDIPADWVCWGTTDGGEITNSIFDFFDNAQFGFVFFVPFVDDPSCAVSCPADVNGDGVVNVLDLIDVLLCFGQPAIPGCEAEDINGDGTVNVLDLIELLLAFGTACP